MEERGGETALREGGPAKGKVLLKVMRHNVCAALVSNGNSKVALVNSAWFSRKLSSKDYDHVCRLNT